MARIAGVNIPSAKRVDIALTYIHGIGRSTAVKVLAELKLDQSKRVHQLSDSELIQIREYIDGNFVVEGELKAKVRMNIKSLMDLASYRGLRHRRNLPVRGQRTHTNSKSRRRSSRVTSS